MPEEKKIIDKILPKDEDTIGNCGLRIDPVRNEIVATDAFVMLTLTIPQVGDNPSVDQFITADYLHKKIMHDETKCIRIDPRYARMHEIWALKVRYDLHAEPKDVNVPIWLDIMDANGKITVYAFQVGANPPVLTELPKQTNLFWEELEQVPMTATKAKITFDQILIQMWWTSYNIGESITYATGTTKNWYQFHLMVRTPKNSK